MASNSKSASASKSRKSHGEPASDVAGTVTYKIKQLKTHIQAERLRTIKEKIECNRRKLEIHVSKLVPSTRREPDVSLIGTSGHTENLLSSRIKNPLYTLTGSTTESGEDTLDVTLPLCAKLPLCEKIPPYTTWVFLGRNQRMGKNESVGRKQIYYDHKQGSEAMIATDTDSEEDSNESKKEKHDFSEAEDRIIRMVFQEFEPSEEILKIMAQYVGGSVSEIQERFSMLKLSDDRKCNKDMVTSAKHTQARSIDLEKSLSASLNSLDNLFCRRCLVFDCLLHGCSQDLITPSEKNSYSTESEEDREPCGDHCYLRAQAVKKYTESMALGAISRIERSTAEEARQYELSHNSGGLGTCNVSKKTRSRHEGSVLVSDYLGGSSFKKQKKLSPPVTVATETEVLAENSSSVTLNIVEEHAEHIISSSQWKPLEKELYSKGVEIFGRNSCLIARNLLAGLKTCVEVSHYMHDGGSGSLLEVQRAGGDQNEQEIPSGSRLFRRRGRTRKMKYSSKSAGHPAILKRIADGKSKLSKQYTPCGCQTMCAKQCPCHAKETCCEKYCGCSKSCKNRFRGCHCAKSQCRTRQCPCFAALRECDPDVCRNCWVSCGDGLSGEPPGRGDGQCGNMRLLLKQHKKILLGRSRVAGWGAFVRNSVNKNDCLGEYTGELISHREADRRGKIYDLSKSSFLFDLNDQCVLDAYRKGDKLKFANHSAKPNCYAKVMMVAGDHRVGIFAKENIEARQELFYDYHYEPDSAYLWARKPEGSKGDEPSVPHGRPRKRQSQR